MSMNILEQARLRINEIDAQMAALFEQRMAVVEDVIAYKLENGLQIFDESREKKVIEKNTRLIINPIYVEYYQDFITHLMEVSKWYQRAIANANHIGYTGVEGAFAHIAAMNLFCEGKSDGNLKSFSSFEDIFKAVENGEIEYGVLPFENSYTGEVGEVLDLLFKYNCRINRVYDLKINQNLLGIPGTKLTDIEQVYSHHQALHQCKQFLEAHPTYQQITYSNTALAAKFVSGEQDKSKAAIASIETAKLYGLEVLVPNINTSAENTTRFVVVSRKALAEGNRFNIMFTVQHNAGQLAKIIEIISRHGFNMESIKSKSMHNLPWEYYFYAELEGNAIDDAAQALFDEMNRCCKTFKVIGSYSSKDI